MNIIIFILILILFLLILWLINSVLTIPLLFDLLFDNIIFHGNKRSKKIAITFDDGPHPVYTHQILDILMENNVKATFFITGKNCEKYPDIVKRIYDEGHTIGNHLYNHNKNIFLSNKTIIDELNKTSDLIKKITGIDCKFFRPPYGTRDFRTLSIFKKMQYKVVMWSVSSQDWKAKSSDEIIKNVLSKAKGGDIILFHDSRHNGICDRSRTVSALKEIIVNLRKRGYELVVVDKMFIL